MLLNFLSICMKAPPCSLPNFPSSTSDSEPLELDGRGYGLYYVLRPGSLRDSSASDTSIYSLKGYQVSQTYLASSVQCFSNLKVLVRPARILICHLVWKKNLLAGYLFFILVQIVNTSQMTWDLNNGYYSYNAGFCAYWVHYMHIVRDFVLQQCQFWNTLLKEIRLALTFCSFWY